MPLLSANLHRWQSQVKLERAHKKSPHAEKNAIIDGDVFVRNFSQAYRFRVSVFPFWLRSYLSFGLPAPSIYFVFVALRYRPSTLCLGFVLFSLRFSHVDSLICLAIFGRSDDDSNIPRSDVQPQLQLSHHSCDDIEILRGFPEAMMGLLRLSIMRSNVSSW